jgi:hypothetical protein
LNIEEDLRVEHASVQAAEKKLTYSAIRERVKESVEFFSNLAEAIDHTFLEICK